MTTEAPVRPPSPSGQSGFGGVLESWRRVRRMKHFTLVAGIIAIALAAMVPFLWSQTAAELDAAVFAIAYVMFALGLNIVVGFAGLLDLGYVAFYAIGAYTVGWFASDHFSKINGGKAINVGADTFLTQGIHLNFLLILLAAMTFSAIGGAIIGFPTLRLRGDYIAIVTLAFGEIAARVALNGDAIHIAGYKLTSGPTAIAPIDNLKLPFLTSFNSALDLRPFYWLGLVMAVLMLLASFSLRDSRLGRAWIAIREDEVAAASMGVPTVRTKLLAYATGAAMGGAAGAFLGFYVPAIDANQFAFSFSILILSMIILGGLGSIWGTVAGAVALAVIDRWLLPHTFKDIPSKFGLSLTTPEISFGIFGFLLVIMMVLRPEGLFPERRRKVELTEGVGADETVFEASA
jgi:branched-chain amino acid transport system permease protein